MARTPESVNDTMGGQGLVTMDDCEKCRQSLLRVWRGRYGKDGTATDPYSTALELLRQPLGFCNLRGCHAPCDLISILCRLVRLVTYLC